MFLASYPIGFNVNKDKLCALSKKRGKLFVFYFRLRLTENLNKVSLKYHLVVMSYYCLFQCSLYVQEQYKAKGLCHIFPN